MAGKIELYLRMMYGKLNSEPAVAELRNLKVPKMKRPVNMTGDAEAVIKLNWT